MSAQLRDLANRVLRRIGLVVHRHPDCQCSEVYDDPYEALFARNNRIVFRLPMRNCVDKLGFSYGSWHPWVETARQLRNAETLAYERATVKAFYDVWSFPLLHEVFEHKIADRRLRNHLLKVFHGAFTPFCSQLRQSLAAAIESSTRYLEFDNRKAGFELSVEQSLKEDGTWSDRKGDIELHRLKTLLRSVGMSGYVRSDKADGDVSGYLLRRNAELRFVVMSGLHRAAVLAAIEDQALTVRMFLNIIIDLDSIHSWPLVRQGLWSRAQAEKYFHHLFEFEPVTWARTNGLH